jgi:prepilin-type N-terminal cleavage/methylation domain-containing protein
MNVRLDHKTLNSRKQGFTLTEIAIVLGIIGLILAAVWSAASSVYGGQKVTAAQNGILTTAQAVRSMYGNSGQTGQTAATAITAPGMFPVGWNSSTAGKVGNPWNVNPTANYSYVYGNGSTFSIELDGITDAGCAALLSAYNNKSSSLNGGQVPGLISTASSSTGSTGGTAKIGAIAASGTYAAPSTCVGGVGQKDSVSINFDMSNM